MAIRAADTRLEAGRRVFTRILVGIDGSEHALEAARQAALLCDVDGRLTILTVWDTATTLIGGTGSHVPPYFDEELQHGTAEKAVVAACDYVAPYSAATARVVRGSAFGELLEEIRRDQDTLVAVGSSGIGRLRGIVEGAVATEIIHKADCSVLVARPGTARFPQRIVVGVDGSVESAAAYAASNYLADRFAAELHAIVAWGGDRVNEHLTTAITGGVHEDSGDAPAEALIAASRSADLVVVGSRGLRGLQALGSVSERVAHGAACSVLVVREPIWQRIAEELGR